MIILVTDTIYKNHSE